MSAILLIKPQSLTNSPEKGRLLSLLTGPTVKVAVLEIKTILANGWQVGWMPGSKANIYSPKVYILKKLEVCL